MVQRFHQTAWFISALLMPFDRANAQDASATEPDNGASHSTSQPTSKPASAPKEQSEARDGKQSTKQGQVDPDSYEPFILSEAEWKSRLSENQFYILRQQGTERAHSGALLHNTRTGTYRCAGCGAPLFSSKTKFKSGTGWPSFYRSLKHRVKRVPDRSHGRLRMEIVCARCNGHLGHVFRDGPRPTGLRHCVNSVALTFEDDASSERTEEKQP